MSASVAVWSAPADLLLWLDKSKDLEQAAAALLASKLSCDQLLELDSEEALIEVGIESPHDRAAAVLQLRRAAQMQRHAAAALPAQILEATSEEGVDMRKAGRSF